MTIIVSPLSHLPRVIAARKPSHVMTLLSPDTEVPVCADIPPARRLILQFNDIGAPTLGLIAPAPATVQTILDFTAAWDRSAPMVIHCLAGISRSTAAAYILACASAPAGEEAAIAAHLRKVSPPATPNSLMISYADQLLGRDGRMIAAVADIGRGAMAYEGLPFDLDVQRPRTP